MGSVFLYQQHTQMFGDHLANWTERSYCAARPPVAFLRFLSAPRGTGGPLCTSPFIGRAWRCVTDILLILFEQWALIDAPTCLVDVIETYCLRALRPPIKLPSLLLLLNDRVTTHYELQRLPDPRSLCTLHFQCIYVCTCGAVHRQYIHILL